MSRMRGAMASSMVSASCSTRSSCSSVICAQQHGHNRGGAHQGSLVLCFGGMRQRAASGGSRAYLEGLPEGAVHDCVAEILFCLEEAAAVPDPELLGRLLCLHVAGDGVDLRVHRRWRDGEVMERRSVVPQCLDAMRPEPCMPDSAHVPRAESNSTWWMMETVGLQAYAGAEEEPGGLGQAGGAEAAVLVTGPQARHHGVLDAGGLVLCRQHAPGGDSSPPLVQPSCRGAHKGPGRASHVS